MLNFHFFNNIYISFVKTFCPSIVFFDGIVFFYNFKENKLIIKKKEMYKYF